MYSAIATRAIERFLYIFFLICSVEDRGHLRALARLSRLISDPTLLAELRQAPDARAVHEVIVGAENELTG